jgi:hypothetical protein
MNDINEKMTLAEFEERLPEFFATGTGRVSDDPRFQSFLTDHPASAALVRDLEYIAEHARSLLEPAEDVEPSDAVWSKIQNQLNAETGNSGAPPISGPSRKE